MKKIQIKDKCQSENHGFLKYTTKTNTTKKKVIFFQKKYLSTETYKLNKYKKKEKNVQIWCWIKSEKYLK